MWKSASNVGLDIGSAGVSPVLSETGEFEVKILPNSHQNSDEKPELEVRWETGSSWRGLSSGQHKKL